MQLKLDLPTLIQQAILQVAGSDERDLLNTFLERCTADQPITLDIPAYSVSGTAPLLYAEKFIFQKQPVSDPIHVTVSGDDATEVRQAVHLIKAAHRMYAVLCDVIDPNNLEIESIIANAQRALTAASARTVIDMPIVRGL